MTRNIQKIALIAVPVLALAYIAYVGFTDARIPQTEIVKEISAGQNGQ